MKQHFTFLMMILLAGVGFTLVSCQKDNSAQPTEAAESHRLDTQASSALDRINAFRESLEQSQSNPGAKDASCLSIDDAVWNVEALFNYTYAYPELVCSRTRAYDTALYLPVTRHDSVMMTDLTLFYERMYGAAGAFFQRDTLSNRHLLLLDVEPGDMLGDQVRITLHTLIGSVTGTPQQASEPQQPWPGPFAEGEWWFYGENGGGSGGSGSDAANELTKYLRMYLIPEAPDGYYYIYTNIIQQNSSEPSAHTYGGACCEFYRNNPQGLEVPDELVLDSDELNFHYFGEKDLVMNQLYGYGMGTPTVRTLCGVHVIDSCNINNNMYTTIKHCTTAFYGVGLLVFNGSGHQRGRIEP